MTNSIQLVAISVGTPQSLNIDGRPVTTAILKTPVAGPVYISKTGPEGDKPAIHPDAVYAMPLQHYSYWAGEFGVEASEWQHGHFGENLTLKGIDETKLRIGDILHVGSHVKLRVVSARVPCAKLAWRLNQPSGFLTTYSLSGKTGFYLEVLEEGTVEAGDMVIHQVVDEAAMTIAELAIYLTVQEATEERVRRILSHKYLGTTALEIAQKRLVAIKDNYLATTGRWDGWRSFTVDEVVLKDGGIQSLWMTPVDQAPIALYKPGQYLPCRRAEQEYRLAIADFDTEAIGYRVATENISFEKGECIELCAPKGGFTLDRSSYRPTILIGEGIGIAHLVSMLKGHLVRDLLPLSLLYFITSTKEHPFRKEVEELAHGQDKVKVGIDGFTIAHLEALMEGSQFFWGNMWRDWPKQDGVFYLSGSSAFVERVSQELIAWGVKEASILSYTVE